MFQYRLKILSLLLLLFCQFIEAHPDEKGFGVNPDIKDLVLMYYASNNRLDWTEEQLVPYVTHTFLSEEKHWFFPAFLFIEFKINNKWLIHNKRKVDYATRTDWELLLNKTFEKNKCLDALDKCISSQLSVLPPPGFRHKVVLTVPCAIKNQRNWGAINGKRLDFSRNKDRITAETWYIQELVKRFHAAQYKNIDLAGVYWVEEDLWACKDIVKDVSNIVHEKGLKFYWIPYYSATGSTRWEYYGFDYVYIQPNYAISTSRPLSRLRNAVAEARTLGCGVELEFDEKMFYYPSVSIKRVSQTMEYFENAGVYDSNTAIAYYNGNHLIYDLYSKQYPYRGRFSVIELMSIRQMIDRIARSVVLRNIN